MESGFASLKNWKQTFFTYASPKPKFSPWFSSSKLLIPQDSSFLKIYSLQQKEGRKLLIYNVFPQYKHISITYHTDARSPWQGLKNQG